MKRRAVILLALASLAALPPPIPKHVKHVHGPTKGDGAAALVKPMAPPAPQFVWLRLDWDYPAPMDGIAFNVYQRLPAKPWTFLARVQGATSYQFPVSSGPNSVVFRVASENTMGTQ